MSIVKVPTDGLTLGIVAASPATHDISGFAALTFVAQDSCAIVDAGTLGDTWSEKEDNTLCTAGSGKTKGKRNFGEHTVQVKYYEGDSVRALLKTAFEGQTETVSVEVTLSNGNIRYFEAQVSIFDEVLGGTGADIETTIKFLRQTTIVEDNT